MKLLCTRFIILCFFMSLAWATSYAQVADSVLIVSEDSLHKSLYLVRHAKSSRENPDWTDFERPLNKRGKRDAPFMGQKLKAKGIVIDLIIASPSARTTETARLLCQELDYDFEKIRWDKSIYRCQTAQLLEVIKNMDEQYTNVLIIGHNPSITSASNLLQADQVIEKVPTCGVVAINFELRAWNTIQKQSGSFRFFDYPKKK